MMQPIQTNLQQVLNYLKQGHKTMPSAGLAPIPTVGAMPQTPPFTPTNPVQQMVPQQGMMTRGR